MYSQAKYVADVKWTQKAQEEKREMIVGLMNSRGSIMAQRECQAASSGHPQWRRKGPCMHRTRIDAILDYLSTAGDADPVL